MSGSVVFSDALLPSGWAKNVHLTWDEVTGTITSVTPNSALSPDTACAAIPAMTNLHSHAFQRAMAGLTETRMQAHDSFWSWRTLMYAFANALTPDTLRDIATWLYVEMLEAGYTHVCEFHYVHHAENGAPYADDATMCHAIVDAARTAGIGLTLLPVLYQTAGFGEQPAKPEQRRFIRATESLLKLVEALKNTYGATFPALRVGVAPHSLRAVPPSALQALIAGISNDTPIHIHIAEQQAEVDACVAWSGQRPVEWLLNNAQVDARWCLVHATHMTAQESARAAKTGAIAGLCPSTEANLGDGIFDAPSWNSAAGGWGIGSDSHVTVNAAMELRLLEYSQRLAQQSRNVYATSQIANTASAMWNAAASGGARAAGNAHAGLTVGAPADWVVLDADHPSMLGLSAADAMSAFVFVSDGVRSIRSVARSGKSVVVDGQHPLHDGAIAAFARARAKLRR